MKKGANVLGMIAILLIIGSVFVGVVTAEDIIIDTEIGESGFTTYPPRELPYEWWYAHDHPDSSPDGWFDTKAYPPGQGNGNFWYTFSFPGVAEYKGIWETSLLHSGNYEVFVWSPSPDPFDPNLDEYDPPNVYLPTQVAKYKIFHKTEVDIVTIDQDLNKGRFTSLGVFDFDSTARVELSSNGVEFWRCVAFDAVKFVPVVNDMAVTDVSIIPPSTSVVQSTAICVTVTNEGRQQEDNISVKAFVDGAQVGSTKYVSLDPGSSDTKRFLWIPSAAKNYSVAGEVRVVGGETDTGDNRKAIDVLTMPVPAPIFDETRSDRGKSAQLTDAGAYTFVTMWPELPQPWYFDDPYGIAVDGSGNVYVADSRNNRIQKFDSDGKFISKWGSVGTGDSKFRCPRGIAVDSNDNVFVADLWNNRIQKFDSDGNFITKWGSYGTGDGEFDWSNCIAVDSNGNVFVTDSGNERIQKFDSDGNFITKWGSHGSGNGEFKHPSGLAIDSSDNVFVADLWNNRIQKFDSDGNFITKWDSQGTGDGEFLSPWYIAIDSSDNVFVADTGNNRIQKFDSDGNFITKWGSYGTGDGEFDWPHCIAVDNSGNVYVVDSESVYSRIQKFDSDGNFIASWASWGSGNGEFKCPWGLAIDSSGNVFVADQRNNRIKKFDSDGNFIILWGSYGAGDGALYWPRCIAVDSSGNVYVVDSDSSRIQKFDSDGNFITLWGYGFNHPWGIAIDSSDNVFVADSYHNQIKKFDSDGNLITQWGSYIGGSGNGEFHEPRGIAVDSNDNVFVVDSGNERIQKFDSDGNFITKWGYYGTGDGELGFWPDGIAVDSNGNVFVADSANYRIQKFDSDGNFITKWGSRGSGEGEFYWPHGIAVDSSGNVFVADTSNHRIQKFAPGNRPIASFTYTPKNPIINQLITFNASNSTADGTIIKYDWEFGDGNTATGKIVTHSYPSARTYKVNLTVTDDNGATDTASKQVTIGEIHPELKIGDIVITTDYLHVRNILDWNNPLDPGNLIFTMHPPDERINPPYGVGRIIDGPKTDDQDGYTWWKIEWDNGEIGWSAEGPFDNPAERWLVKTDKPFVKIQDLEDPFNYQAEYELNQAELRTEEKKEEVLQNVTTYAKMYKISPALIMAIIRQESDFEANAMGDFWDGEYHSFGYMQVSYGAATDTYNEYTGDEYKGTEEQWKTDGLDPETNIKYGVRYLRIQHDRIKDGCSGYEDVYGDILKSTISAYNAGHPTLANRMCYVLGGNCNGGYTGVIEGKLVGGVHRGYMFFLAVREPTQPEYNPKLIIPIYTPTFQKAHAGTTVTYIIRVTNEGTAKDTIKLSLSGDLEWDLHLSETSVTLAPGESTDVYLYLTIGQQIDTKTITITGISKGDISKTSSCTVLACNIGEGHGLFAVSLFFKNNDARDHTLNFNVPDYVKISDKTITLSPSGCKWINVVFDPKSSISFWFNIEVADITSGESVKIAVEFPEYDILATNFDMATDSYSFKNPRFFCYGMSETSILYFKDEIPLPFKRQNTYSLSKFEAMPNIFSHQRFFKESFFASLYQKFFYVDEAEEYDYLVKNIVYDCPMILGLQNPGVFGEAHAVVVYKIILDPDADKAYIFIYDNEYPYDMSSDSFYYAFPYAVYNKASQKFTFGTYNKFLALDAKKLPLENIPVILIFACPVNITLIDQYGRIISDNGTNEIPGAGMILLNKTKRFYLPTNLTYSAEIDAYDVGLFNFTRVSPVGNNFSLTAFENISVTASTKAFVEIAPNVTNYTMKIDYNGDGHIDEEKNPDVNETIEMNQPPIASFTYSPAHPIVNQQITFNASSSYDPDGNITNYEWNFDDENITDTTDPIITHTYVSAGAYTVNLTVTDDYGATDTDTTTLTISELPSVEQPQYFKEKSSVQGIGYVVIDKKIQDWNAAIDVEEYMEGFGEFAMESIEILNGSANISDPADPNYFHQKMINFQGNATNRLINTEKFESPALYGGTGTKVNEFFDVSEIQKQESCSIKTISAPGERQSHSFETTDEFSGTWSTHSEWQKTCQKEIEHYQLFKGNFSVQKELTFEREVVVP